MASVGQGVRGRCRGVGLMRNLSMFIVVMGNTCRQYGSLLTALVSAENATTLREQIRRIFLVSATHHRAITNAIFFINSV